MMIEKEYKGVNYQEDSLFTEEIKNLICQNMFSCIETHKHPYVNAMNIETDVVLICETPQGYKRYIGIELKESDISKAQRQAFLRRRYFDYFYIIVNIPVNQIVYNITHNNTNHLKVGIISTFHKEPIIVCCSPYIKRVNDKLILSDNYKNRFMRAVKLNQRLSITREENETKTPYR